MLRTRTCRRVSAVTVVTAILGLALPASADDHPVPIRGQINQAAVSATKESDGLHVTAVGEGNASHLGRLTTFENAVIAGNTIQGTRVLTAANGDQLFWTDMAMLTSTGAAGTITFTGGTGRFSNASGTALFEAVLAADGIHATLTFEGTIQY
jgi:hypothetical protein